MLNLKSVILLLLLAFLAGCSRLDQNPVSPQTAQLVDSVASGAPTVIGKPGAEVMGGTYADQQWWRSLTQSQRNVRIRQAAYNEYIARGGNGSLTARPWSGGYTCKTWVQLKVVPFASNNVATIPTNNGSCSWNSGVYVRATGVSINGVTMGQIIQTKWGANLHTAIVWDRDSGGVWWIDCNYDLRSSLMVHYIPYSTFNSKSGGCYTVYEVIGG